MRQISEIQKNRLEWQLDIYRKELRQAEEDVKNAPQGDHSENAELDAAKNAVAVKRTQIADIGSLLADCEVVKYSEGDRITPGSIITIKRKLSEGNYSEPRLFLFDSVENILEGTIGVNSQLGKAIEGNTSGEYVIQTDFGEQMIYKVEKEPQSKVADYNRLYPSKQELFKLKDK